MNNPLWMPKGSVRGAVALMIVFTFCASVLIMVWQGKLALTAKDVMLTVTAILTFYFMSKKKED